MCVAMPGRVLAVRPDGAEVEVGEAVRTASTLLLPDVGVGDYVLVSAGTIVERLSDEEALERLALFAELIDALDASEERT